MDDLELGLNEIGIIAHRCAGVSEAGNVRLVSLHFDAGLAGKCFRQNTSHQRCGDDDEEEDGQDDGLAAADNAPIIQEMQFSFGRG